MRPKVISATLRSGSLLVFKIRWDNSSTDDPFALSKVRSSESIFLTLSRNRANWPTCIRSS